MAVDKKDPRIRRTLAAIRQAFFDLVLEKDYSNISITELTERAEVNRKTFYLHYKSLNDLVRELEEEVSKDIMRLLENESESLDVVGCVSKFYRYMDESSEVYRRLLCDPGNQSFYHHVTDNILHSPTFRRFYEASKHPEIVRAYCSAITSMYRAWLDAGQKFPLSELERYAGELMLHGYDALGEIEESGKEGAFPV